MYLARQITITAVTAAAVCSASAAYAAGECARITNAEERLVCIEKKADAVPSTVQNALQGVKIEQVAHPGICLFFKDRDQPAYAIFDCSHTQEQTFNIRK